MKKALLLTGILLVLAAPMAMAAGVNFAWGTNCWGAVSGPSNVMTFACGSNTSPANWKMTASFMVDADMADYGAVDVLIEGVSEAGAIPDWWKRSASGDCNYGTGNWLATATTNSSDCADPFSGTASGGAGYGYLTPTQIQIEALGGVAEGVLLPANTETFGATITIKNTKTVGTGSCAGCNVGMVFGLYDVILTSVAHGDTHLTEAIPGGNQCLIWQHSFTGQPCNPPVPARNTTWGQVKSLYR